MFGISFGFCCRCNNGILVSMSGRIRKVIHICIAAITGIDGITWIGAGRILDTRGSIAVGMVHFRCAAVTNITGVIGNYLRIGRCGNGLSCRRCGRLG